MRQPPRKRYDLVMMAIDCLEEVERDTQYLVNMWTWHEALDRDDPDRQDIKRALEQGKDIGVVRVGVCPSGAIMAKRLGCSTARSRAPSDFGAAWTNSMYGLDKIKDGSIESGCQKWSIARGNIVRLIARLEDDLGTSYNHDNDGFQYFTDYHDDHAGFKQNLCVITEALRSLGI